MIEEAGRESSTVIVERNRKPDRNDRISSLLHRTSYLKPVKGTLSFGRFTTCTQGTTLRHVGSQGSSLMMTLRRHSEANCEDRDR
jgi:hypothetical protein